MLRFIYSLLKKSKASDVHTGVSVPLPRELSAEQTRALDLLLSDLFAHLPEAVANAAASRVRKLFFAGESFSTALLNSAEDGEPLVYLSVDINDSESASGFATDLCQSHGLLPPIQIDFSGKSVSDILCELDICLSGRGYRLVKNTDVDWAFEGFIAAESRANSMVKTAALLGVRLALGCQE